MITSHNVPIDISSKPAIKRLIATGQLTRSSTIVSGLPGGEVYAPVPGVATQLAPTGYHTLAIGSQLLQGQFFRLPEYELTALMEHRQATGFSSHRLHGLLSTLMAGRKRDAQASRHFVRDMIDALSAGPQRGLPPLVDERWVGGVWLPDATRIVLRDGLPFISLGFDLPIGRDDEDSELRRPIGIDVGLNPLITYATTYGQATNSGSISPVTAAEHRVITAGAAALGISSKTVDQVIELLTYSAARALLELHLIFIRSAASVVYVEKLDLSSFASDFAERGRALAVIDFLSSWLPQQMHVEHVQVEAINPCYTSLTCAVCHRPGTRVGKVFMCGECGHVTDADKNASLVMLAAGMAYTLGRRVKRRK